VENFNFGRNFRIREHYNLQIRVREYLQLDVPAHAEHVKSAESDRQERARADHRRIWCDGRRDRGQYDTGAGWLGTDGHPDSAVFVLRLGIFEGDSGRFFIG
jgi:hypothetical protein